MWVRTLPYFLISQSPLSPQSWQQTVQWRCRQWSSQFDLIWALKNLCQTTNHKTKTMSNACPKLCLWTRVCSHHWSPRPIPQFFFPVIQKDCVLCLQKLIGFKWKWQLRNLNFHKNESQVWMILEVQTLSKAQGKKYFWNHFYKTCCNVYELVLPLVICV